MKSGLHVLAGLVALAGWACASTSTDTGSGGAEECAAGLKACGELCADLATDARHCGACGNACEAGHLCDGSGECALSCQSGLGDCGGKCVDTNTDNANCGACGAACGAGEICGGTGQCGSSCQSGLSDCNGKCVDTGSDGANCGGCGNACDPGYVCDGMGACALSCQSGLTDCSGTCVDTKTDNKNCGACGMACDPGYVCDGMGACALSCQSGLVDCGGTCVDTKKDDANCGACAKACDPGFDCVNGACALSCQMGLIQCGGTCVDPQSNPSFCGASGDCQGGNAGKKCAQSEACHNGVCKPVGGTSSGTFLLNARNQDKQYVWDPKTNLATLFHQNKSNDVDCNASEGSGLVWFGEHVNDHFGNFVYGSGNGFATQYTTPYAYPKHVTVFGGSVYVMSRNDATIKRYNPANGQETSSKATGNGTGQGMATDGTSLYASFWNGSSSFFQSFDQSLALKATIQKPTGLTETNVVDVAYDKGSGHFFGMVTNGEGGTGTQSTKIVEFVMGGAVVQSYNIPQTIDGLGQNECP